MINLQGRHIVVIGAGSGLGWAAVQRAVEFKARVLVVDINPDTAELATTLGPAASFAQCDVRDPAAAEGMFARAVEDGGGIDGVLTTVGGARLGSLQELDLAAWNGELAFNLTSAYIVCRSALPHLAARGGGAIVTTSSGYAVLAGPDRMAYAAAKAGVIAFTRSFAKEAARHRVRANCLAPGPIDTPRFRAMNGGDEGVERVRQSMPLGTIPKPEDIANAAIFLLSDAASQITGQVIHVNGGLLMP